MRDKANNKFFRIKLVLVVLVFHTISAFNASQGVRLDASLISQILNYAGPYTNEEEEHVCQRMVESLTVEEQEIAARTSYTYWLVSSREGCPSEEARKRTAMKEARRHLVGEGGSYGKAIQRLKETCAFRKVRESFGKLIRVLVYGQVL